MKTVKREEPIIRHRFTECPDCKTRNFRVKKTIEVGRCRSCHESFKIITVYAKNGTPTKTTPRQTPLANQTAPESSLPSWQLPSDTSLFGTTTQTPSTSSSPSFSWDNDNHGNESESSSSQ